MKKKGGKEKPLLDKKAVFVDENGNFRRPNSYPNGDVNVDNCEDLYDEWKAQIEKLNALSIENY
mgnify:CR=1 FL=1